MNIKKYDIDITIDFNAIHSIKLLISNNMKIKFYNFLFIKIFAV